MATALLERLRETRQMGAMRITAREAAAVVALVEAAQRARSEAKAWESGDVSAAYAALDDALEPFVSTQEAAA